MNLCCSAYFAWWDKDHSVPWWDVFPGAFLFFTCAVITLYFSSLMLISAAALAVPWRQSHCNTALMCPWVLHVPLSQGVSGWLWLPLIYIKAPPISCLWRGDMALCTLLILLISYSPSLLIPTWYSEFSLCSSLPFVPRTFLHLLFVYVWLFYLHFYQWFLFLAIWMSLSILHLGVLQLFFISCGTGQAASPPLWRWVAALDAHLAKQKSSTQSSLRAGRRMMGAGFVSGWFTDVVTIQPFG